MAKVLPLAAMKKYAQEHSEELFNILDGDL
jgi:hypothetical protein